MNQKGESFVYPVFLQEPPKILEEKIVKRNTGCFLIVSPNEQVFMDMHSRIIEEHGDSICLCRDDLIGLENGCFINFLSTQTFRGGDLDCVFVIRSEFLDPQVFYKKVVPLIMLKNMQVIIQYEKETDWITRLREFQK